MPMRAIVPPSAAGRRLATAALLLMVLLGSSASPGACAGFGELAVSLPAAQVGVAYGAQVLGQELGLAPLLGATAAGKRPAIRAGLPGDELVAGAAVPGAGGLSDQGFAWLSDDTGIALVAATPTGLMYGLLELADRLHNSEPIEARKVSEPSLALRGDYLDLPFYLGCDLYDGRWRWYQDIEATPASWFHDRAAWTERFRTYARRRMNALFLQHPHPFPAFLTYPDRPDAAYFDETTVARNAETLRWLIDEAARHGIGLYLQTWNEWVPRGYAQARGVPQEGPATPDSAALNRYSYVAFFRRFPGMAGLVTMAAESPPGCVEFVRDHVVKPLAALPRPPRLIFWTWCAYPENVNTILDGYPGETAIMHYLQYEQLFKPMIDPRVGRMSRACGGRPMIVLGGLGTATGQLYWADPFVIRDILRDAPRQNVNGMVFCGLDSWQWVSNKWIGWEALARYWWDSSRQDDNAYWERRIAEVLGDPALGEPLLSAYTHASAVPTRLLCLLHSQSDVFRPQYGLALAFYLGMPTLSTYVFENHTHLDAQGRLAPRLGLAWPNPDWGEKVVGVVDFVAAEKRGLYLAGTTPLDIADELAAHATAIAKARQEMLPRRARCSWGTERFDTLLGVLTMNELLARHNAAKIRAAVAWQRWHVGAGPASAVLPPLDQSVSAFARYAAVAERLYPKGPYGAKRNVLTKPIPWTNLDLWNHYTYDPDYRFSEYARRLVRERDLIARALAEKRPELPFELDLLPPLQGRTIARLDADGPSGGFAVKEYPPQAMARMRDGCLVCVFRGTRADFYFPLVTDPEQCPLERGKRHEVSFRYEVLRVGERARRDAPGPREDPLALSFGARTTEGTWRRDVGARYFHVRQGTKGEIRTQFVPQDFGDYYVYLSMNGNGVVAVEDVRLVRE